MFRQEDILRQLQEGADAGALAQQFTDALNAAIAQKNAEDAAKNKKIAEKVARMQAIVDEVFDFVDEFYPDFKVPEDLKAQVNGEMIVDAMEQAMDEVAQLTAFMKNHNMQLQKRPAAPTAKADAIADFLRANGLA
jgi:predicted secreted protein